MIFLHFGFCFILLVVLGLLFGFVWFGFCVVVACFLKRERKKKDYGMGWVGRLKGSRRRWEGKI